MLALIIIPLLLAFTLFDSGDGDADVVSQGSVDLNGANGDGSEVSEDVGETADVASLLNIIELTNGDDEFIGTGQLDEVNGLGGDDRLLGQGGVDFLSGGAGDDIVRGGGGGDFLGGDAGNDRVVGAQGDDILFGGPGDDTLEGQDGDDLILGGAGADRLLGGSGDDILYSFRNDGIDPAADGESAPEWNVAHFNAFDAVAFARPELSVEQVDDILSVQGFGEEDQPFSGVDGQEDALSGGSGDDILFLGAGDEGEGGVGADAFVVTTGNSGGGAAIVTDYDEDDDVMIVSYAGANPPVITVDNVADNAEVRADGEFLALVLGAGSELSVADIRLVQAG
jgi:Ca2+-binding RTX toxin-like protein